jgi:hypothetical protein
MQLFFMKLSRFSAEDIHVVSEIYVLHVGQDGGKCEISDSTYAEYL